MELGGKGPNIVFADANIDAAVQTAFWAIFWNKGEVCVAGSRLLVERPVYDEVVEKLANLAKNAVLGDPLHSATQVGPIASKAEYDKVLRYVDSGKQSTARLVAGGGVRKINGKCSGDDAVVAGMLCEFSRVERIEWRASGAACRGSGFVSWRWAFLVPISQPR